VEPRRLGHDRYYALLAAYLPWDDEEAGHWATHMHCWESQAIGFDRPKRHLTASAFVMHPAGDQVLVHWHAKLQRWLQPGGHLETGESPGSACLRELLEEVGLVFGLPPEIFDLDVHRIPETRKMAAHDHVDARFLLRAPTDELPASPEGADLRWLPWDEFATSDPADIGLLRVAHKIAAAARAIRAAHQITEPARAIRVAQKITAAARAFRVAHQITAAAQVPGGLPVSPTPTPPGSVRMR
jgi:8-oxo-dGTP pyrophosphatase MutT (NUDIX family)